MPSTKKQLFICFSFVCWCGLMSCRVRSKKRR